MLLCMLGLYNFIIFWYKRSKFDLACWTLSRSASISFSKTACMIYSSLSSPFTVGGFRQVKVSPKDDMFRVTISTIQVGHMLLVCRV